jgi:hypothetical protein
MLQDPWHMLPGMLHGLFGTLGTHNMGGYEFKTWQAGKEKHLGQKGRLRGGEKIAAVLFILTPLTSMGICKS